MDVRWVSDSGVSAARLEDVPRLRSRGDGFVWLDVPRPNREAQEVLRNLFELHPLAVGECLERIPLPKVHVYPDHAFIVLNGLERGADDQLHLLPMKQFVGLGLLITCGGPCTTRWPPSVRCGPF